MFVRAYFWLLFAIIASASQVINSAYLQEQCGGASYVSIAESIPVYMNLQTNVSTFDAWMTVINSATTTLDLAEYYITLTEGGQYPPQDGGAQGIAIYESLKAAHNRGVKVRLLLQKISYDYPDTDALQLAKEGIIELRQIDWDKLVPGGILHTKLIIADSTNFYLGSANFDWRSLTQVKELGAIVMGCPLLGEDIMKEFEMYWLAANTSELPKWNSTFATPFNLNTPAVIALNNTLMKMFISTSPPQFTAPGRTDDITALLAAINSAEKSVSIEVMDYCPCSLYDWYHNYYWAAIDDALRAAAFRGVKVQFLAAKWKYSLNETFEYLYSLNQIANITVKFIVVPNLPPPLGNIPYARVNHAKFVVTDKQTYISTSNWSADYFTNTGGISLNWYSDTIRATVQQIFDRDWNSPYSVNA